MRNSRPFPFVFTDYFANVFLLSLLFVSRLEFDDVTPPCGGVGALVFVLDGVGEDACFSLFPLAGVLLRPQHDRLRSVGSVDAVERLVQGPCFAVLVCRHVEEVLLHWALGRDAHDDHACLFVLVARLEDPFQHAFGRLHQRGGGVGGREDPRLLEVPILAVWRNTPTTEATLCCALSFSAHRAA